MAGSVWTQPGGSDRTSGWEGSANLDCGKVLLGQRPLFWSRVWIGDAGERVIIRMDDV